MCFEFYHGHYKVTDIRMVSSGFWGTYIQVVDIQVYYAYY